jgi:hypothetical protein
MKSKQVTVTVKRTIQTASYESSTVEISEVFEIEDDDDPAECRHEAYATVTKAVKRGIDNEFKKYMRSANERAKEKKEAGL